MFSTPSSTSEPHNYDFEKEENAAKWKGVFVTSLRKVTWWFSGLYVVVSLLLAFSPVLFLSDSTY